LLALVPGEALTYYSYDSLRNEPGSMSASITLHQVNTTYNDDDNQPAYRSVNTVEASEGIPLALFVFRTVEGTFSHVASTNDVVTYPDNQEDATSDGLDYYRLATVTRDFDNVTSAQEFAAHVRARLDWLATDYPATADDFVGDETYTYTTSE
jgi:hypothetical protein